MELVISKNIDFYKLVRDKDVDGVIVHSLLMRRGINFIVIDLISEFWMIFAHISHRGYWITHVFEYNTIMY